MKKINKLLILLLVLCVPFAVKADMGAPMIREYKATIINSNGVDYYDREYNYDTRDYDYIKKGHYNSGTTVYVLYEETSSWDGASGALQVSVTNSYSDSYYIIKEDVSSIQPVEKEFIPDKTNMKNVGIVNDVNIKALTADEVKMYKGPSIAYESVGTIPKNTEIAYKYAIGDYNTAIVYIYTEYNGQKGWVNVLNEKVYLGFGGQMLSFDDIDTLFPRYILLNLILAIKYSFNKCKYKSGHDTI